MKPLFAPIFFLLLIPGFLCAADAPPYRADFEEQTLSGWKLNGDVICDSSLPFEGKQSLKFTRSLENAEKPCNAVSPAFPVVPGLWDIQGGSRAELYSPDLSFEAVISIEFLDAQSAVIGQKNIGSITGKAGWKLFSTQVEAPKAATAAQFKVDLRKTSGFFWVDDLSATYGGAAPVKLIDRLVFSTVALGNLLYPTDSRVIGLRVETFEELPAKQQTVQFGVRDYWGAEQMETVPVPLQANGKTTQKMKTGPDIEKFVYEGTVDLAKVPLLQGKYYEMYGEIPQEDRPFRNHSGLSIQPEAAANAFPPQETSFTSRNWHGGLPEGFHLSHRIGLRIINIWSGWKPTPPYEGVAPCIELVRKYNMAPIFRTPTHAIETRTGDWELYTDEVLRKGMRKLLETYGQGLPAVYVSLGNEPPVVLDRIPRDVEAYKSLYEEIKKVDPNITVATTAIGPQEEFMKAGMGKYCDVYDFHTYEDPLNMGIIFNNYEKMFAKYGDRRPIWSTETGLNSAGISRHTVAIDMIKKIAYFFSFGGEKVSWFDLFYPDPNATNFGSNGESFDVFDSRYVKYNPKITAISYFDLINTITTKKFVSKAVYDKDIRAFLMRDKDNHSLQIIWKDAGFKDVQIPLPGVQKVTLIKLDGEHRELDAGGKGISLRIGEEPLLLTYDSSATLAETLEAPPITVAELPSGIVRGGSAEITVKTDSVSADQVNLVAPAFWNVTKTSADGKVTFTVAAPDSSRARAAEMTVTSGGESKSGEFYLRLPVDPKIAARLEPIPPAEGQRPSVKLVLKNNGAEKQEVTWGLSMVEENALVNGAYDTHRPTKVRLDGKSNGQLSIAQGATGEVLLPLEGTDPLMVYRIRAVITDATGETAITERNVAGFVAVPKTATAVKLDGVLDDADWKRAPVEKIDQDRQYYILAGRKKPTEDSASWKGAEDLSATIRYLWDDTYLYVGVEVTDDNRGAINEDSKLWLMDGLQFLVDPCRAMDFNTGKYDYVMAVGKKGPQAWCSLSADPGAATGEAKDIVVTHQWKDDKTGTITYELAFPWSRLAPFKPGVGANLGLTMILNEDDGKGRKSFMCWFGNAHSKQVDGVGDLILAP